MSETANTWKRLSEITWESVGWVVDNSTHTSDWIGMHDLEFEMSDLTGIDVKTCEALITAAKRTLPVEISWENAGGTRVERQHGIAMVDSVILLAHRHGPGYADRIRVRYLGSAHDVYLNTLRSAKLVGMSLTFPDVPPCANPWHKSAPARARMDCPECPNPRPAS